MQALVLVLQLGLMGAWSPMTLDAFLSWFPSSLDTVRMSFFLVHWTHESSCEVSMLSTNGCVFALAVARQHHVFYGSSSGGRSKGVEESRYRTARVFFGFVKVPKTQQEKPAWFSRACLPWPELLSQCGERVSRYVGHRVHLGGPLNRTPPV